MQTRSNNKSDTKESVFDYVKEYDYAAHDKAVAAVPDDPSELDDMLKTMKSNFFTTRQTFDVKFRKT